MNEFFQYLGIGLGTAIGGVLAAKLAGAFRHAAPGAEDKLMEWTTKTSAWLHEKIGTGELSPTTLEKIRSIYHAGISWVESIVGNEEFLTQVLYILRGNVKKIPERLWPLVLEWIQRGMPKELPAALAEITTAKELKNEVVNPAKETLAVKPIRASLALLVPPDQQPSEEEIRGNIRAIAPAAGRTIVADHSSEPVTKETLSQLIEESRARQEALRK